MATTVMGNECGSYPSNECEISTNTDFQPGTYALEGIRIVNSNLVVDCRDALLQGDNRNQHGTSAAGNNGFKLENLYNVTIKNCILNDFGSGIVIDNSYNIIIEGNTISITTNDGIQASDSHAIHIVSNTLTKNTDMGIQLSNTYDVEVFDNEISTSSYGLFLYGAESALIEGNTFTHNPENALQLNSVVTSEVRNNHFENSSIALNVLGSSNNVIENNVMADSKKGVVLKGSSHSNMIHQNSFVMNTNGVDLAGGTDNTLYENEFNGNNKHILNQGTNTWFVNGRGNAWDDYRGLDNGEGNRDACDGIGDTQIPHLGVDAYPLIIETMGNGCMNISLVCGTEEISSASWPKSRAILGETGIPIHIQEFNKVISYDLHILKDQKIIYSFSGTDVQTISGLWAGIYQNGTHVPDGTYAVSLVVEDAIGQRMTKNLGEIIVDQLDPEVTFSVSPQIISPYVTPGDEDYTHISASFNEEVSWNVMIKSPTQNVANVSCWSESLDLFWNGTLETPLCSNIQPLSKSFTVDACNEDVVAADYEPFVHQTDTSRNYSITLFAVDRGGNTISRESWVYLTDVTAPGCITDEDQDGVCDTDDAVLTTDSTVEQHNNTIIITKNTSTISLTTIPGETLDLRMFEVTVFSSPSAVIISSLVGNHTKTATLENQDLNVTSICIKDASIMTIDKISQGCNGTDEYLITCDNQTQNGYICDSIMNDTLLFVSGLHHSGIRQQCGDGDGDGYGTLCMLGNDCNDEDPLVHPGAIDECGGVDQNCDGSNPACSSGSSSGGSSSGWSSSRGSSGSAYSRPTPSETVLPVACLPMWHCTEWSACNGTQERTCTDSNECDNATLPLLFQTCTVCEPIIICDQWSECIEGLRERPCNDGCGTETLEHEECATSGTVKPPSIISGNVIAPPSSGASGIGVFLFLFMIMSGVGTLGVVVIKQSPTLSEPEKELKTYITSMLQEGYQADHIRNHVIDHGWPAETVQKIID